MIQRINIAFPYSTFAREKQNQPVQNPIKTNVVQFKGADDIKRSNISSQSLISAYQAMNGIKLARTVSFEGSMKAIFTDLRKQLVTCKDLENGMAGEDVGSMISIKEWINRLADDFVSYDDSVKTTIPVTEKEDKENGTTTILPARTQIKRQKYGDLMYEIVLRSPVTVNTEEYKKYGEIPTRKVLTPSQQMRITLSPNNAPNGRVTPEEVYILETRGKLMSVVEDGKDVLLTNAGSINKKSMEEGRLSIFTKQRGNKYVPSESEIKPQKIRKREVKPSVGKGTEVVIGLENGRFVGELIKGIEDFSKKVESGQVLLDPFVEKEGAQNIQFAMLAGGYGSRAEYANASSSAIFHDKKGGAQSTKGVFQTATGLTPMETTFISLHKAGLLDCSKLKIGENIKFYLNKSGVNRGSGGFTAELYDKMQRDGRESLFILPNDSMSRLTEATGKVAELMNSGKAAIAMIAKEVKSEDAKGNFGIMKLNDDNEILAFAEKPKEIPEGYEKDGNCLTNTFQFAVSKEAFSALSEIEPYLYVGVGKEKRDWSGLYVPIIMALTQEPDAEKIQKQIYNLTAEKDKETGEMISKKVPLDVIEKAKNLVAGQKVYAVPTDEPWADCGTLNALYHTTMQIASGDFPLEDFERAHVLECINPKTGLVASSKEQKERIEAKYDVLGEVMATEQAEPVDKDAYLEKYKDASVVNEKAA